MVVISLYLLFIVIFAVIFYYMRGQKYCIDEIDSFQDALFFSVETLFTLGYAWPSKTSPFPMAECTLLSFMITFESIVGILLNVFFFGAIYAQLSSG